MRVLWAQEPLIHMEGSVIFLAGPTPREDMPCESWRPAALNHLHKCGYRGTVLAPEARDGVWRNNYDAQVEWELEAMGLANVVLFWLCFKFPELPGLTTRTEFGMCMSDKRRMVVGIPDDAERVSYQRWHVKNSDLAFTNALDGACRLAAAWLR